MGKKIIYNVFCMNILEKYKEISIKVFRSGIFNNNFI